MQDEEPTKVKADEVLPGLTVTTNGHSGIEIRAILKRKYNCAEFTLRDDVPQAVFISPWIQFEPNEMSEERERMAYEIVRRTVGYGALAKQVRDLLVKKEALQQVIDKRNRTQETTYRMWREDRAKAGLPEDFSDIKQWPQEMMGDY